MQYEYSVNSTGKIVIDSFHFGEKENAEFKKNLEKRLERVEKNISIPFGIHIKVISRNTFPHSSGIASSASSMAAFSKMLCLIYDIEDVKIQSIIARLLSGSACRSLEPGWNLWGETSDVNQSSDQYAISMNQRVHPEFHSLQDWIFVCSRDVKSLSSSDGHKLMDDHSFLDQRIRNAHGRLKEILKLLEMSPTKDFFEMMEQEALELHSLMMTSRPPYLLLEPESLMLMKKITSLRNQGVLCGYTLDAGSSVHLIFPKSQLGVMSRYFDEGYFGVHGINFTEVLFDECSYDQKLSW